MQNPDNYHAYQYIKISEIYEGKWRKRNMPVTFNQRASRVITLASRLSSSDSRVAYSAEVKLLAHLKSLRNRALWPKGLDGLLEVLKQGQVLPPRKANLIDTLIDKRDLDKLPEKTKQLFREVLISFLQIKCRDDELILGRDGIKYFLALSALGENKFLDFLRESSKRIIKTTLEHDKNSADRGLVEGRPIAGKDLLAEIMAGVLDQAEDDGRSQQVKEERALVERDKIYYALRDFFIEDGETLTLKPVKKRGDIERAAIPLGVKAFLYQALGISSPLTLFILPCRFGQVLFDVNPFVISHVINHLDVRLGEFYGQRLDQQAPQAGQTLIIDGTEKLNQKAQELRLACFRMVLGAARGKVLYKGEVTEINRDVLKIHSPYDRPAFDFWVGGNGSEEQLLDSLIESLNILLEVGGIKTSDAICFENGMLGIVSKHLGPSLFSKDSWLVEVSAFKEAADKYRKDK